MRDFPTNEKKKKKSSHTQIKGKPLEIKIINFVNSEFSGRAWSKCAFKNVKKKSNYLDFH